MSTTTPELPIARALEQLDDAVARDRLTDAARANIRAWLTEPRYADDASEVLAHIEAEKWKELDDVFWTIIPFGTAGRRGRMYPIGTNAINDRTIGESARGLADYVKEQFPDRPLACAIAYDTRHRSRHFAELCAEVMTAAGLTVHFLDGYRSTPALSFAVRHKGCVCGIMVTASHNPPSDNAVKAYWETGAQLLPPHDQGVIDRVASVGEIPRLPFSQGLASGQIVPCQEEIDPAFLEAVVRRSRPGPRDLKIIYSPLHGVGTSVVVGALRGAGFEDVEVFAPHAEPDGDFPNVPDHVSNPENPRVFDMMIDRARRVGADLVLATDPDCDRVGCAAPATGDVDAPWVCLTGNQIGSLLADYLLETARVAGTLTPEHYVVKTLVTTELIRRIAESHGVRTVGDLLVGFKWIGQAMDAHGPERFVLGAEESYGFLVGDHARDKDAAVASMLLAELAAHCKAVGLTLCQKLDRLMQQHGMHCERTISVKMPGSEGMDRMRSLMARFRSDPPKQLADIPIVAIRDYATVERLSESSPPTPRGDLIFLDLAEPGNAIAVRPSGTEPKVKFYLFTHVPPESSTNIDQARASLVARLNALEQAVRDFAVS